MKLDDAAGREPVMKIRFHGVRGSYPVPGAEALHFGGNTSCVEVESDGFRIVFDCGTGAVALGDRSRRTAATGDSVRAPAIRTCTTTTDGLAVRRSTTRAHLRPRSGVTGDPPRPLRVVVRASYFPWRRRPRGRACWNLVHGDVLA
jgi:hypothetical protein